MSETNGQSIPYDYISSSFTIERAKLKILDFKLSKAKISFSEYLEKYKDIAMAMKVYNNWLSMTQYNEFIHAIVMNTYYDTNPLFSQ